MKDEALSLHRKLHGKIGTEQKMQMQNMHDMAMLYTPGVADVCMHIKNNPKSVYDLTVKHNMVAIVSDGTRILGLGKIGAEAAIPLMEGKALIMKQFANIDAFPICIKSQDKQQIIDTVKNIAPVFGAINLEDIESPKVFEIEEALEQALDIPVFHDDQHGTAMVVLAGLMNALKIVGKDLGKIRVGLIGAGGSGYGIANLLIAAGVKDIVIFDSKGAIGKHRNDLTKYKQHLAKRSNPHDFIGQVSGFRDADVMITVTASNTGALPHETVKSMAKDSIVFALSNPVPELTLEEAKQLGIRIFGTGRSDYPNQINNAIGFPGVLRALLDYRIPRLTDKIKIAAARGIARTISGNELNENKIVPDVFDKNIVPNILEEVKKVL